MIFDIEMTSQSGRGFHKFFRTQTDVIQRYFRILDAKSRFDCMTNPRRRDTLIFWAFSSSRERIGCSEIVNSEGYQTSQPLV